MKSIAIASGKGGTGKTTVSVNLAHILSQMGWKVNYLDCDVEEPNGHLYFPITLAEVEPVLHLVPEIDESKCTLCRRCERVCQFRAILILGETIVVNEELCHACGGCTLACRMEAIKEVGIPIGVIERGQSSGIQYIRGLMKVGTVMATPVISKLLEYQDSSVNAINILDAPPGTSCPVVETLKHVDYVVLVAEPTPFSLHDLQLTIEMIDKLGKDFGVVINKAGSEFTGLHDFLRQEGIQILAEIPFDMKLAKASSMAKLLIQESESIFGEFFWLAKRLGFHPQNREKTVDSIG